MKSIYEINGTTRALLLFTYEPNRATPNTPHILHDWVFYFAPTPSSFILSERALFSSSDHTDPVLL